MNKTNLMFDVMQQEMQRQKMRLSRNYAQGLTALLHIDPHGKHLIALLGDGHESSNLDALSHWVYQRLQQNLSLRVSSESAIEAFRHSLISELMDFQS